MEYKYGNNIVYTDDETKAMQIINDNYQLIFNIKTKILELLSKEGKAIKNFKENISLDSLNIIFCKQGCKTKIELREKLGIHVLYDLYIDLEEENMEAILSEKFVELLIRPYLEKENVDKPSGTTSICGFVRRDNENVVYGQGLTNLAIKFINEYIGQEGDSTKFIKQFAKKDKVNLLFVLLLLALRNDFEKEIKIGEIFDQNLDKIVNVCDGKREPINFLTYGLLTDSIHTQREYERYLGEQKWKRLLQVFDDFEKEDYKEYKIALNTVKYLIEKRMKDKYHSTVKRIGKSKVPSLYTKAKLVEEIISYL